MTFYVQMPADRHGNTGPAPAVTEAEPEPTGYGTRLVVTAPAGFPWPTVRQRTPGPDADTQRVGDPRGTPRTDEGAPGMSRYQVVCTKCGIQLGRTDFPREALGITRLPTGHSPGVVARGLVNRVRYDLTNRGRT